MKPPRIYINRTEVEADAKSMREPECGWKRVDVIESTVADSIIYHIGVLRNSDDDSAPLRVWRCDGSIDGIPV